MNYGNSPNSGTLRKLTDDLNTNWNPEITKNENPAKLSIFIMIKVLCQYVYDVLKYDRYENSGRDIVNVFMLTFALS